MTSDQQTFTGHYGGDHDRAISNTLVQRMLDALIAAGLTQATIAVATLRADIAHIAGEPRAPTAR